jgi:hypothetical protein
MSERLELPPPGSAEAFEEFCAKALAELQAEGVPYLVTFARKLPMVRQVYLMRRLSRNPRTQRMLFGNKEFILWVLDCKDYLDVPYTETYTEQT